MLEVSSPGFDRPLFSPEQVALFIGQGINVRLIHAIPDGATKRRKVVGKLTHATDKDMTIVTEDKLEFVVLFDNVDKAHLIYED